MYVMHTHLQILAATQAAYNGLLQTPTAKAGTLDIIMLITHAMIKGCLAVTAWTGNYNQHSAVYYICFCFILEVYGTD